MSLMGVIIMVSNTEQKERRYCRVAMNKLLGKIISGDIEQINFLLFQEEVLLNHNVPDSYPKRYVEEFYIKTNRLRLEDNNLKVGK